MQFKTILYFLFLFFLFNEMLYAQNERLTLENVIDLATSHSLDAHIAESQYQVGFMSYHNYKANRRPSLDLNATPLNFMRSLDPEYDFQDGSFKYVEQQTFRSGVNLSLGQHIPLTGGRISLNSDISRLDNIHLDQGLQFSATLMSLRLTQDIFGFNRFKWDKRIEPLKYEIARKERVQSREDIAVKAVDRFFIMAAAQVDVEIAESRLQDSNTLYEIGKQRFDIGTVSQQDLYRLRLNGINARIELEQAQLRLNRAQMELYALLRLETVEKIELIYPEELPDITLNPEKCLQLAIKNNPEMSHYSRQILEAEMEEERTRRESGFTAMLDARIGVNQTGQEIGDVFSNPSNQQIALFSLSVPILDWGTARRDKNIARKNREVVSAQVEQAQQNFRMEVLMRVEEFNLNESQFRSAVEADKLARHNYEIALQRFKTGHIDVSQLNDIRRETIDARQRYINAMQKYWQNYYTIRSYTLYDFIRDQPLTERF